MAVKQIEKIVFILLLFICVSCNTGLSDGQGQGFELVIEADEGFWEYSFDVPKSGLYQIHGRVIPEKDGTFLVDVDGRGKEAGLTKSSQWQWQQLRDTTFLIKGEHALSVGQKESRAKLDKIKITSVSSFDQSLTNDRKLKPPFDMPIVKEPVFAERTFNIKDYGAVGDGKTKNTEAFAKAIDACFKAGGGRVLVPEGLWYTGPIHLKSFVDLHLSQDAEIFFSNDFEDYLPVVFIRFEGTECYNYSPLIYARDCVNIAITGKGNINGNGGKWWQWSRSGKEKEAKIKLIQMGEDNVPVHKRVFGYEDGLRPVAIQIINCKNILLEDLFLVGGGPFWTIDLVYSENIIARGLTIINHGPNNDGVNPDSSKNVIIENCYFQTQDDAVAIKSGRNNDGRRVGIPSENIIVRNCQSVEGYWGTISIGSEMSAGVRNVFVHDCYFYKSNYAFFFKTTRQRGGLVENVWIQDIDFTTRNHALRFTMGYPDYSKWYSPGPGVYRNIHIKNMKGVSEEGSCSITGLPGYAFENVTIENLDYEGKWGFRLNNAKNIKLTNVCVRPKEGPAFEIKNSSYIDIKPDCPVSGVPFIKLSGERTDNIYLVDSSLKDSDEAIVSDPNVSKNALIIK